MLLSNNTMHTKHGVNTSARVGLNLVLFVAISISLLSVLLTADLIWPAVWTQPKWLNQKQNKKKWWRCQCHHSSFIVWSQLLFSGKNKIIKQIIPPHQTQCLTLRFNIKYQPELVLGKKMCIHFANDACKNVPFLSQCAAYNLVVLKPTTFLINVPSLVNRWNKRKVYRLYDKKLDRHNPSQNHWLNMKVLQLKLSTEWVPTKLNWAPNRLELIHLPIL